MKSTWRFLKDEERTSGVDCGSLVAAVMDAGGKVIGEPLEIPGVGQYVSFIDTKGNRVNLLQPISRNWHTMKPE